MVRVSSEEAPGRRNKGEARRGDQSKDEIVQDGHVVSCRTKIFGGTAMQGRSGMVGSNQSCRS
jgi:hypothetical protein